MQIFPSWLIVYWLCSPRVIITIKSADWGKFSSLLPVGVLLLPAEVSENRWKNWRKYLTSHKVVRHSTKSSSTKTKAIVIYRNQLSSSLRLCCFLIFELSRIKNISKFFWSQEKERNKSGKGKERKFEITNRKQVPLSNQEKERKNQEKDRKNNQEKERKISIYLLVTIPRRIWSHVDWVLVGGTFYSTGLHWRRLGYLNKMSG